jgi:hypothetical protein
MRGMEVRLPGGLLKNGALERRAVFAALTGKAELALLELEPASAPPAYVNSVLLQVLETIGHQPVEEDTLNALCVADRQYLMLRLAALLGGEQLWLKATCGRCRAFFDIDIRRCDLPLKPAGETFPVTRLELPVGQVEVRVPTAKDQLATLDMPEVEALTELLRRCITRVNGVSPDPVLVAELSPEDIAAIDRALDELSPAVCNELLVVCPECRTEQSAKLNHYALPEVKSGAFYDEIHTLAMHYHWGEEELLKMPRARRRRYLALINRSTSLAGQLS